MPKAAKLKIPYFEALKKELDSSPMPKIADVGKNFVTLAGGPVHFANQLWNEFCAANPGSVTKQRILAMVMQCLKVDEDEYSSDSLADMEEADIELLWVRRLKELGVINEQAEPDSADRHEPEGAEEKPQAAGADEGADREADRGTREDDEAADRSDPDWPPA